MLEVQSAAWWLAADGRRQECNSIFPALLLLLRLPLRRCRSARSMAKHRRKREHVAAAPFWLLVGCVVDERAALLRCIWRVQLQAAHIPAELLFNENEARRVYISTYTKVVCSLPDEI